MNLPHDSFCVLPWISLEASPVGTVRPCCLAEDEITDAQGRKFILGEIPLDTIQDSAYMQTLRADFLAGQRPATCRKCWREEESGRTSKRLHTLQRLEHILDESTWTEHAKPLMFLDLKLGNICNLKCRICGSWSSSAFAAEEIRFQTDRKNNIHYEMIQQGRWPRERPQFWRDLEQHLDGIRYIEFTGGEPFLIAEQFELLEILIDRGLSRNIEIHYNTNGTVYPQDAENLWREFRCVEIAFSIDDVAERFEYQRDGAEWSQVTSNIKRFRDLRSVSPNIRLQVCCTVNVFNITNLLQVSRWISQQGFDFVYWNMLHDAPENSIAHFPDSVKQEIANMFSSWDIDASFRSDFDKILAFMQAGQSRSADGLRAKIRLLDQRRGQDLRRVIPELSELLDYHG